VYLPVAALRRFDPSDHTGYPIAASGRALAVSRQSPTWVLDRWIAASTAWWSLTPAPAP
jgi:hypothetical protein